MKNICFTGHRAIKEESEELAKQLLDNVISELIKKGAVNFYCGGALGWDTICADMVLFHRKRRVPQIKLHLILPCPPEQQTLKWTDADKQVYYEILESADDVEIVSKTYSPDCMKKRNARLVELADCCICYYDSKRSRSGTGQTVRMAGEKGIHIINIFEMSKQ